MKLEELEKVLKGFSLSGVNLILVKDYELLKQLSEIKHDGDPIWLVRVNNLDDIRTLNEKDMEKAGWVRKALEGLEK